MLVTTILMTTIRHNYNRKGHSPRSNKTHNLTKCHMSQFFFFKKIIHFSFQLNIAT